MNKELFIEELEDLGSFDELYKKHFGDAKLFILCDENTQEHCLPLLDNTFGGLLANAELIVVEAGEGSKNLEVYEGVVETLIELEAKRDSVLLNLGGGVITDLGAFVAATFKRGISFINMPTSLLAMVDAAWGSKNGLNIGGFKNQVGSFKAPSLSILCPVFLHSLPDDEINNGKAEMLKHGLIAKVQHWTGIANKSLPELAQIKESIGIKMKIVGEDLYEESQRKALNFGHTIGHALETFYANKSEPIAHGRAVLAGMICESFLSQSEGLSKEALGQISEKLMSFHEPLNISKSDYNDIISAMGVDKKRNEAGNNFSLLKEIGKCVLNVQVKKDAILESLDYYRSIQ